MALGKDGQKPVMKRGNDIKKKGSGIHHKESALSIILPRSNYLEEEQIRQGNRIRQKLHF